MSRVIKNNDGVAVVEGTPAASLVKDVDKFFAAKPPERMAGESIAPVRRDRMLTGKFKDKDGNEIIGRKPTREEFDSYLAERGIFRLKEKDTMYGEGESPLDPLPPRPGTGPEPEPPPRPTVGPEPEPPRRSRRRSSRRSPGRSRGRNVGDARRDNSGRDPNARGDFSKRNEAKDKAESRRKRFFQRRRSKKEAERSQREQEATQGRFITTLKT